MHFYSYFVFIRIYQLNISLNFFWGGNMRQIIEMIMFSHMIDIGCNLKPLKTESDKESQQLSRNLSEVGLTTAVSLAPAKHILLEL